MFHFAIGIVFFSLWATQTWSHEDSPCDLSLLVNVHQVLQPTVRHFSEVHFNFTGGKHYEVVEVISMYQAHQLCRNALNFVESLRLTLSLLVCPRHYLSWEAGHAAQDMVALFQFSKHLGIFFADIRYMSSFHEEHSAIVEASDASEAEVRSVATQLERWVEMVAANPRAGVLGADKWSQISMLIEKVLDMVRSFLKSLVMDLNAMFMTPNFVSAEEVPTARVRRNDDDLRVLENLRQPMKTNIFSGEGPNRTFQPDFMDMLRHPPMPLIHPHFATFPECASLRSAGNFVGSKIPPRDFMDVPHRWAHTDVSGTHQRAPSPMQLLHAASRHTRLSDLVISIQVASYLLNPKPSCGSFDVLYDPTQCLLEGNSAAYVFEVNPFPPFNLTVQYAGRSLGPVGDIPSTDVHSIDLPSRDTQWSSLVSTYKSMNSHSPDILFLSPFVGNCLILDRILNSGVVKPKFLYVPINPLDPPPVESEPNFFMWWQEHGDAFLLQLSGNYEASHLPIATMLWLAQCSLASAVHRLRRQGYELNHLEHTFAVFAWEPLWKKMSRDEAQETISKTSPDSVSVAPDFWHGPFLAGAEEAASVAASRGTSPIQGGNAKPRKASGGSGVAGREEVRCADSHDAVELYAAWLRGWQCSPHSRYLFSLEVLAMSSRGVYMSKLKDQSVFQEAPTRSELRELAASAQEEVPGMRYFLGKRSKFGLSTRGHCAQGLCECFPPYRGRLCELEDLPRVPQKLRGVIHYITAENEQDLIDLSRSLVSVWERYNAQYDYPVIIFHEGLSPMARRRIALVSNNRVWFVLLSSFKTIPTQWARASAEVAQDFAVGYRAMIRWRSGPVFLEASLADFDFAMTLDTDSYFPADLVADPFTLLEQRGLVAIFPHLGRESASVVVNFMHYYLLYCRLHDLHPRRSNVLSSLVEVNFKWYQQCLMLDMEVLRLDWFRGLEYQDFFQYMDSTGGFWLHRWGNNPFRTFAIGLLLDDANVSAVTLPYAHQDFCSCGAGAEPCVWEAELNRYKCVGSTTSGIVLRDLAEGLRDLQPWRGTQRQVDNFKAEDIYTFVEDQMDGI